MSKKFITGEQKHAQKDNKKKLQPSQLTKITSLFKVEKIVKSTSRPNFTSVEVLQNDVSSNRMVDEREEQIKKVSVLENSNGYVESEPSEREEKRRQIQKTIEQIIDNDTQSDTETELEVEIEIETEEQQKIRQAKEMREAKQKIENIYQLPYYFQKSWNDKERILKEIADKKHIKRHEFFTQMTQLIRISNTSSSNVNLDSLKIFVTNYLKDKSSDFFENLVPFIAKLALEIIQLDDVPILVQNEEGKITLTKRQVATFLANMFFCTLTSQISKNLPYGNNFKSIFAGTLNYNQSDRKIEKIICIYNYFLSVKEAIENRPGDYESQKVTYHRIVFDQNIHSNSDVSIFWKQNTTQLTKVIHKKDGNIEDFENAIHLDFANAYIGGGVLDHGLVQEEIRFMISPELIISRLFCPKMEDREAIMIIGSEIYTKYSGYGDTFHCEGRVDQSNIKLDSQNRKLTAVLAIDAIHYGQSYDQNIQYRMNSIIRELLKAYIGFHGGQELIQSEQALQNGQKFQVSTGRWGCGIFMGDPQLKFLIQWVAASLAQRDMIFCSFKDKELDDIEEIIDQLQDKNVSYVINLIHRYTEYFRQKNSKFSLFQYAKEYFESKNKK
ncbi:hypothetical protein ABPG74_009909 [Tetrahymena malaccensis]